MRIILSLLCLSLLFTAGAQESTEKKGIPEGEIFTSTQTVSINGKTLSFATQTGTVQLRDENDKPIALFGFTHYQLDNSGSERPIVFAFNGGPLSASFWLHFGILGPKRIVINDPGYTGSAPYEVVNNEFSILDKADLVMIDPVGTGLSVPIGKAKFEDF